MTKKIPGIDGQLKLVPVEKPPPPPPKPPVIHKKEPPPEPPPPKEPKKAKAPLLPPVKPFVHIATDEQVVTYIRSHPGVRPPELIREFRVARNRALRLINQVLEGKHDQDPQRSEGSRDEQLVKPLSDPPAGRDPTS